MIVPLSASANESSEVTLQIDREPSHKSRYSWKWLQKRLSYKKSAPKSLLPMDIGDEPKETRRTKIWNAILRFFQKAKSTETLDIDCSSEVSSIKFSDEETEEEPKIVIKKRQVVKKPKIVGKTLKYLVLTDFQREKYIGPNSTIEYAKLVDTDQLVVLKRVLKIAKNNELKLLTELQNRQNFIQLLDNFEIARHRYMVLEFPGHEWLTLFDYIYKIGAMDEATAREVFLRIFGAVKTLEELGYYHNDLKDENILINRETKEIKLIDFGSASKIEDSPLSETFYGTLKYGAPEVQVMFPEDKSSDSETDDDVTIPKINIVKQEVWTLGIILYGMLFGVDPFANQPEILTLDIKSKMQKYQNSRNCRHQMISDEAIDLVSKLLEKDAQMRPSLDDILSFDFFQTELVSFEQWLATSPPVEVKAQCNVIHSEIKHKSLWKRFKKLFNRTV